jgi:hypothetical protein
VQVLVTLLAKVFFGRRVIVQDADAAPVLPHLANVALDEDARAIIGEFVRGGSPSLLGSLFLLVLDGRRQPGILQLPAHAARHFLLFLIGFGFFGLFHLVVAGARPTGRGLDIVGVVEGLGAGIGVLWRGDLLALRAGAAFAAG